MKYLMIALLVLTFSTTALAETYQFTTATARNLQGVLRKLEPGDKVVLERGTYEFETGLELVEKRDVKIEGRGRVDLVISDLDSAVLSVRGCGDIRITGIRARHRRPAGEYRCEGTVIEVYNSEKVYVGHCRLNGCGAAGVYAVGSRDVIVHHNDIFNNTYAAVWVTDSQVLVHDNEIHDNAAALSTYGECDVTFTDNHIENNQGNDYTKSDYYREITGDR